jgi:hypothetical protein
MKIEQRAELSNGIFSSERFDRVRISPSRGTAHIDRVFWHLPAPRPLSLYSLGHHVLDVRLFFAILDGMAYFALQHIDLKMIYSPQSTANIKRIRPAYNREAQ